MTSRSKSALSATEALAMLGTAEGTLAVVDSITAAATAAAVAEAITPTKGRAKALAALAALPEAAERPCDTDEIDLGPVLNPDGSPSAVTIGMLTGLPPETPITFDVQAAADKIAADAVAAVEAGDLATGKKLAQEALSVALIVAEATGKPVRLGTAKVARRLAASPHQVVGVFAGLLRCALRRDRAVHDAPRPRQAFPAGQILPVEHGGEPALDFRRWAGQGESRREQQQCPDYPVAKMHGPEITAKVSGVNSGMVRDSNSHFACCAGFGVHPLGCFRPPHTLKGGHQTGLERQNENCWVRDRRRQSVKPTPVSAPNDVPEGNGFSRAQYGGQT